MPRLRGAKRISLGGTAEVGGRWGMAAGGPGVQLDLMQITAEDNGGWQYAVMRGRRQIGCLGQWPDGWCWALRGSSEVHGPVATRPMALAQLARAWSKVIIGGHASSEKKG